MGLALPPQLERSNETVFNFMLRLGVSLITVLIHLTYFYPGYSLFLMVAVVFQGLIYPPLIHSLPVIENQRDYKLKIDSIIYGLCIGAWGFNLFLASFYLASASIIAMAAGGVRLCVQSIVVMLMASAVSGYFNHWNFVETVPTSTMLIAMVGFFLFMTIVGGRTFAINTRLRQTRTDLRAQTEELQNLNTLALAVNAHLDVDILMKSMMKTMERIYPFEALYILTLEGHGQRLEVTGIYGSSITQSEHSAFQKFEFDIHRDYDSIFVKSLINKKVLYLPSISPEMVAQGAKIDQDLFAVKPSISLAYFPIYIDEQVIAGACFINYEKPFTLDKVDLQRIQQYLVQVGTAVRNATLFKELEVSKSQAEQAQQKAEASEEAKGRFLANMSHEIRTPLTAIMGYSEALTDRDITEAERQKFIGHILRSGDHLLSMINDILDISKIEATKIEVERIACNLVEILCDIESYSVIKCKDKSLYFRIEIDYPIPQTIHSDPTRLKQILLNLCNNAIKFTEQGGVLLKVEKEGLDKLKITIEDTGIGIAEAEQRKIFSAFEQADTSTTRIYGGTGLGLYISKNLAQLLGGDLTVTSKMGVGSRFVLTTLVGRNADALIESQGEYSNAMKAIKESKTHSGAPTLQGQILVAEDNPENQNLICRLIHQTGLTTDVVNDGKQAVDAALNHHYSLILLDVQMPIMSGLEAAKAIIEHGINTPMVAFTANVMKHQIDEYRDIGFVDVLEKPISREKLFSTLQHVLLSDVKNKKDVLIVEDNEVNQMILYRYVTKIYPAAEVFMAGNGADAMEQTQAKTFDLILMDMEMPKVNGLEATQKMRGLGIKTPIYIVSGNVDRSDRESCLRAGANGHIGKPIVKDEIQKVIQDHLFSS